ncbi:hypothetical protein Tco_1019420 [Tanacetum coccineum]|uniref:Uncharacterized protein n=1 Tax=Tanacetum coccineum TaxID=301880 RepID=A0ABQ5FX63_9ASTR
MDDPNITMEEYIRLEEEKARRHGRTFNWQTATFGKVKNYEDEDDHPIDFETEFPAIVFDNTLTAIQSEPTVCPPNKNELDFRISLDESDDEDYTVIFDENSFSYKIISVNDLKETYSGDDKPLSPNPTADYFDDLDYFKDLENEFPAIVYNDGLTSKSDFGIRPLINSECIDEINLIDETSLSEYDEEIVSHMAPLLAADQRHPWLRYQIEEYTEGIRHSYEQRLKTIWSRPVNRVHVLDFEGLTAEMRQDLAVRLRMVYSGEGQQVFVSHAWRRLFGIRGPLVREFILEFLSTCRMSDTIMDIASLIPVFPVGGLEEDALRSSFILSFKGNTRAGDGKAGFGAMETSWAPPLLMFCNETCESAIHRMIAYSISGRGQAPEKVTGIDLFYLRSMDCGTINVPHLLAQYLFRHAEGRKSGARLSGGHFIGRLAMHFGLVSDDGLRGLQVVTRELPLIDLHELGRLHIYTRYDETWTWVAHGPERQQAAAAGTEEAGQAHEEAAPEIPAPTPAQAPLPPPPAPQPRTMSQRIERLEEEVHDLQCDVVGLRGDVTSFTTEQSRVSTWLISCIT